MPQPSTHNLGDLYEHGWSPQPRLGSTATALFAYGGSTDEMGDSGPVRSVPFAPCAILTLAACKVQYLFHNDPVFSPTSSKQLPHDLLHTSGDEPRAAAIITYAKVTRSLGQGRARRTVVGEEGG